LRYQKLKIISKNVLLKEKNMPDLQPIRFQLADVDIQLEPPTNLPAVANALLNNRAFPDTAFTDGAISLGSIKASASRKFKLDKVEFGVGGGIFAGVGVYRSSGKLFEALKAQGLDEPMVTRLEFPDLANKNLYAVRWGYDATGSINGSVALGTGLTFGASGRTEALYAVVRSLNRTTKSIDALTDTVNSWRMPRQIDSPADEKINPETWLIAETDGELKLSLGIEYGYDYSWVREAVKIGGLSGDFGLKIEMGAKAVFGFNTSGRYATVLARENAEQKLRLQIFKLRQQGWSFAFDAAIAAQIKQDVIPENFEEFIKGVFNLHGLQILQDIEKWLDPNTTLANLFGGELVEYAKKFVKEVTGFNPETEFKKAIEWLREVIKRWQNLPHEVTSLLYGFLSKAIPLDDLQNFLKRIIDLSDSEKLKNEILAKLQGVDFFQTTIGKWMTAIAGQGILSLLANIDEEKEKLKTLAQKTLDLLDGTTVENTLKKLQKWIEEKLGLDKIFAVVNEADFAKIDAWLKKRLSDFFGKTIVFQELEKLKKAINALREKANDFYKLGLKALTDKYTAEFHASFQKSTSKTALLDITFDFAANADNAKSQLAKALKGDFTEILAKQISGVKINQGVLTHEIKRNTHLEVKLPYFSAVRDHITESLAKGEVVDAAEGRLWIFNLKASDTVIKKNSLSKLSVAVELNRNAGIREFSKESFRYDYTLLLAKRKARRTYLEDKLENIANEYFKSEFIGAGKSDFAAYLTDLDKLTDQLGIGGSNNFGNIYTSFHLSLPGKVLAAWKNAPLEKKHPIYLQISREVQKFIRRWLPLSYIQDNVQYHQKKIIYPILVYCSLPPINKIEFQNGIPIITAKEIHDWDYLDKSVRNAVVSRFCPAQLKVILARIRAELNAENDGFVSDYLDSRMGSILALDSDDDNISENIFEGLIFKEKEIIKGIVETGRTFRRFLDEQDFEKAIELLAKFGGKITDSFNENLGGNVAGSSLRPLSSLLMLEIAKTLDPMLSSQFQPLSKLDLYVLQPDTPFNPENFFKGILPEKKETAIHQSIVGIASI
jgi:hypothetical protein